MSELHPLNLHSARVQTGRQWLNFQGFSEKFTSVACSRWLEKQLNRVPLPADYYAAGREMYNVGMFVGAATMLELYINTPNPLLPGFHLLGYAYFMCGQPDRALSHLSRCANDGFDSDWQLLTEIAWDQSLVSKTESPLFASDEGVVQSNLSTFLSESSATTAVPIVEPLVVTDTASSEQVSTSPPRTQTNVELKPSMLSISESAIAAPRPMLLSPVVIHVAAPPPQPPHSQARVLSNPNRRVVLPSTSTQMLAVAPSPRHSLAVRDVGAGMDVQAALPFNELSNASKPMRSPRHVDQLVSTAAAKTLVSSTLVRQSSTASSIRDSPDLPDDVQFDDANYASSPMHVSPVSHLFQQQLGVRASPRGPFLFVSESAASLDTGASPLTVATTEDHFSQQLEPQEYGVPVPNLQLQVSGRALFVPAVNPNSKSTSK